MLIYFIRGLKAIFCTGDINKNWMIFFMISILTLFFLPYTFNGIYAHNYFLCMGRLINSNFSKFCKRWSHFGLSVRFCFYSTHLLSKICRLISLWPQDKNDHMSTFWCMLALLIIGIGMIYICHLELHG